MKRRRAYPTLAAYIDGESVNQVTLAKRAKITQGHLSLIISGQRTPRLPLALRLSQITNVPVEALVGKLHTQHVA